MAKPPILDGASVDWNAQACLYDVSGGTMLRVIGGPLKTCLMVPKNDQHKRLVYVIVMEDGARFAHDEVMQLAYLLP